MICQTVIFFKWSPGIQTLETDLFTKIITFSRKLTEQIFNRFYHYFIPSPTEDEINLFDKIKQFLLSWKHVVCQWNRKIIIYHKIPKIKPRPPVLSPCISQFFLPLMWVSLNICPWNTFYIFYSLKLGRSTSTCNKSEIVICIYLFTPFLSLTTGALCKCKHMGLFLGVLWHIFLWHMSQNLTVLKNDRFFEISALKPKLKSTCKEFLVFS